jgi:hypothetical protein
MGEQGLHSLLPRDTKTWSVGGYEMTIDLVLALEHLAAAMTWCKIHGTEHGSDHCAIEMTFDLANPMEEHTPRLMFKDALWEELRQRVASALTESPRGGLMQQQADRLMSVVLKAVDALVPRTRPSPYVKRWWTKELTEL